MINITATEPPRSEVTRAKHAGNAYDEDIADCHQAIAKGIGLHYVAHVTCGIFDFSLESSNNPSPEESSGRERTSRQLSLAVAQLDAACEQLDSGALIRVVLQGDSGALYQFLKVVGQSFIGLTFDGAAASVDRVDRELAFLTRSAAHRVGAASLRWGGFRQREESDVLWMPVESGSGSPHVAAKIPSGVPDAVYEACQNALNTRDVHLVGIYRRGELVWRADIFDDPALAPFFQRVTPAARRRGYDRLLRRVHLQTRRIRQLLAVVRSERLVRLILDVARGAIYVLPIADGAQLVAVTLAQTQVDIADQKVRSLHSSVLSLWQERAAYRWPPADR